MILYHGSYLTVSEPDLSHSRETVDFGRGFYTTPIYEQAKLWSLRFKNRKQTGIISIFEFDEKAFYDLNILDFKTYSEKWLDFIINCRIGKDSTSYDIVMGGVANDRVFNTVELYMENLINKDEAIKRLRYESPNMQIAFRTEKSLGYLKYKGSEHI